MIKLSTVISHQQQEAKCQIYNKLLKLHLKNSAEITPKTVDAQTRAAIEEVIEGLDSGKYRVAEKN